MKIPEMAYFMLGWMCLDYLWFKPGGPLIEAGSSWKKTMQVLVRGEGGPLCWRFIIDELFRAWQVGKLQDQGNFKLFL